MLGRMVRPVVSSAPAFDPATLSLTGWWRASYPGSGTWLGTASAGGSGTQNLLEVTNFPSVGTAVNSLNPATFDGVNDKLAGAAFSTFATSSAYSGWALLNIVSIGTNVAAPSLYDNDNVWSNGAFAGVVLRSSGSVVLYHFDGGQQGVSAAFSTATWQLVQWKYDGTNIKIRVNGGAWSSTAAGSLSDLTSNFQLSASYDGTAHLNGDVLEVGLASSALSDANFDNILSYARSRYALALP